MFVQIPMETKAVFAAIKEELEKQEIAFHSAIDVVEEICVDKDREIAQLQQLLDINTTVSLYSF